MSESRKNFVLHFTDIILKFIVFCYFSVNSFFGYIFNTHRIRRKSKQIEEGEGESSIISDKSFQFKSKYTKKKNWTVCAYDGVKYYY